MAPVLLALLLPALACAHAPWPNALHQWNRYAPVYAADDADARVLVPSAYTGTPLAFDNDVEASNLRRFNINKYIPPIFYPIGTAVNVASSTYDYVASKIKPKIHSSVLTSSSDAVPVYDSVADEPQFSPFTFSDNLNLLKRIAKMPSRVHSLGTINNVLGAVNSAGDLYNPVNHASSGEVLVFDEPQVFPFASNDFLLRRRFRKPSRRPSVDTVNSVLGATNSALGLYNTLKPSFRNSYVPEYVALSDFAFDNGVEASNLRRFKIPKIPIPGVGTVIDIASTAYDIYNAVKPKMYVAQDSQVIPMVVSDAEVA